jgi:hypothetical protein
MAPGRPTRVDAPAAENASGRQAASGRQSPFRVRRRTVSAARQGKRLGGRLCALRRGPAEDLPGGCRSGHRRRRRGCGRPTAPRRSAIGVRPPRNPSGGRDLPGPSSELRGALAPGHDSEFPGPKGGFAVNPAVGKARGDDCNALATSSPLDLPGVLGRLARRAGSGRAALIWVYLPRPGARGRRSRLSDQRRVKTS